MYARYIPPGKGSAPAPKAASPPPVGGRGFTYSRYIPTAKPASAPVPISIPTDDVPLNSSPLAGKKKRKAVEDVGRESPAGLKRFKDDDVTEKKTPESRKSNKQSTTKARQDKTIEQQSVKKAKKSTRKSRKARTNADSSDDSSDDSDSNSDDEAPTETDPAPEPAPEPIPEPMEIDKPKDKAADSEEVKAAKAERKKRKEKRALEKQQAQDGAQDEDLDEKLAEAERHRSIMERKTKSLKLAEKVDTTQDDEMDIDPADIHDLAPLPQPEQVEFDTSQPGYETLPSWLAQPIRVSPDHKTPFGDLDILPKAARFLEEKGFENAFAVQTAAIPLLMPTSKQQPGDVLISAATGSGKTLAYALPIVRDLSSGVVTRLRALVVLPTRELVGQAQDVFELCAKAYQGGGRKRVRIGVSFGGQLLRNEQETLIERETRFAPEEYAKLQKEIKARRAAELGLEEDDEEVDDVDFEGTDPRLGKWKGDVIDFSSKVDILICTPGRLVEHLEQTPGFSLDYVRWLVVDEADKLLSQSFQGWLDTVLEKFKTRLYGARQFPDMDYEGVRKVVLSATLTRDLGLLNQLSLRRPKLVVLETGEDTRVIEHSLPSQLKEFAVRVHETNLKPLYLLDMLNDGHMTGISEPPAPRRQTAEDSDDTSSEGSSDSDSDSDTSSAATEASPTPTKATAGSHLPTCLIFTKSNESALRLSRLLTILSPSLTSHIATITSTTPTSQRRKLLRSISLPSSPLRLLVASDLVARGIDIRNLDHVINYDLPASVAGYVHRVGRTARAGRSGCAWTLVADEESGWFWGKIAKAKGIERMQRVERVRVEEMGEDRVGEYEDALDRLGKEAVKRR
ncbi:P-loop containing nucleoside triphosphate hydrolase protein [Sarocladium strictum]